MTRASMFVLLFLFACSRPAAKVAPPSPAPPAAPAPPAPLDPMLVAAVGAGGVIVIESAVLLQTPLGHKVAGRLRAAVEADGAVCDVDIVGAIEKVWVGISEHDGAQRGAVAIRGLDRPALERCVQRIHESRGEALDIVADGRVAIVGIGEQETLFAAWLDATTVLMTAPPDDRGALDALLATVPEPAPAIAPLMARIERDATAWAVFSAGRLEPLAAVLGSAPRGLYAWVHYKEDFRATVGIGFADAAAAATAAARGREWLAAAAGRFDVPSEYLQAVTIETEAAELVARIELDANQLAKLAATFDSFLQ